MSNDDLKERFFDAAQEILATEGYGGLKLAAVCKRLKVTTGAFYHAFENWTQFTSEFLHNWRRERTTLIAELSRSAGDPVGQLEALLAGTLDLRHGSEAAIRVWAAVDPAVAEVQKVVDNERYEIVLEAMNKLVGTKDGPRWANWGLNVLVGYEMSTNGQDSTELEWELRTVLEAAVARREARRTSRRTA
ncbi:MAG: TetR family transcriptional regulator [Marmoricola sp.]|nr:TetR family transcriptional regulator [Marmoricola sp.]